ncbi:sensor histidine kinase, partial [Methylorubrum aminovorans]
MLALATYQKELTSRILFFQERKEKDVFLRQSEADKRALGWLRQLARFLRHEVRQPVAQINSGIELVRLSCLENKFALEYLETATRSTQAVWALIERASRATDAAAFVRQGFAEDVEISSILNGIYEDFKISYSGVNLRYRPTDQAMIRIDPIALNEAISNLLNNAASFADEDTFIDMYTHKEENKICIAIENKGPLLERDPNLLFQPFSSTRADSLGEHQGIGLYVVKLISEHYNGTSTIENLADSTGVKATLMFPMSS